MAAPITDFASLRTAFEEYLARPDLTEYLPFFLQVTEAWLNRKLRTREMQATVGVLPIMGGGYTLPADYLEWIGAIYANPSIRTPLSLRFVEADSAEFRYRHRPNGDPQYFTVLGDQLQTRSTKAGTVTLTYYRQIPALTEAQPTNWLIQKAPELYLYGTLAEAYRFQKDEARSTEWANQAAAFLMGLMGQGDAQKVASRPNRAAENAGEANARNAAG